MFNIGQVVKWREPDGFMAKQYLEFRPPFKVAGVHQQMSEKWYELTDEAGQYLIRNGKDGARHARVWEGYLALIH